MSEQLVLCMNSGSSSLKFALVRAGGGDETRVCSGAVERIGAPDGRVWLKGARDAKNTVEHAGSFADHGAAMHAAFDMLDRAKVPQPTAVGHRIVHGGPAHTAPARIDAALLAELRALIPFAPLHLPAEISGIEAVTARAPAMPQVACFDTAFHHTLPEVAKRFPLPRSATGPDVHRFGFHGLSYEYVVSALGARELGRAVIAHLGNGASLAAVRDGVSIDTTMGFTPTGGVMMGTRTGDLDPGLIVYLLTQRGYDARTLEQLVDREAGLRGVSETTQDMRELLTARAHDPRAALAVEMFCYSVRKAIGALAAALSGIDTLVFTGGIGEHAPEVRAQVCEGLVHLGVRLDRAKNEAGGAQIHAPASTVAVHVVATDEERVIARHTTRVLDSSA